MCRVIFGLSQVFNLFKNTYLNDFVSKINFGPWAVKDTFHDSYHILKLNSSTK